MSIFSPVLPVDTMSSSPETLVVSSTKSCTTCK